MLTQQFSFIVECEKLKAVLRRSSPIHQQRRENTAEHSWSVVISAMVLAPELVPHLDATRILKMLAVHDLVEIDAGDTFCYADQSGKFEREDSAAQRIFALLPEPLSSEFYQLWLEFERVESQESKFANAIDRLLPLMQNFHNKGGAWREHDICFEQVYERNREIHECSEELWEYARDLIEKAHQEGYLPKRSEQGDRSEVDSRPPGS